MHRANPETPSVTGTAATTRRASYSPSSAANTVRRRRALRRIAATQRAAADAERVGSGRPARLGVPIHLRQDVCWQ